MKKKGTQVFSFLILKQALISAFLKFSPLHQLRNPVMFTVYIGTVLCSGLLIQSLIGQGDTHSSFILNICIWLWLTLFFANFSEALAEGRGKAQAQALRRSRQEIIAKKLNSIKRSATKTEVSATLLRKGDIVLVEQGDFIPCDGEVVEGVASVNESAVTGESAPVIRESGGDRSAVTGGTQVISDWLIIRISASPGENFIDEMIKLVEGAERKKTPNEIALSILLSTLTLIFLLVCVSLLPFSIYSVTSQNLGMVIPITVLIALFVCLAPTTIGALLSAIGIAGMDRMVQSNVIALSGKAVESAGDVDILILDKTGTITLGNRQATEFIPINNVSVEELADASQLASLADETPEGRSIVVLAKEKYGLRGRHINELGATFIPFTAQTRISGVNMPERAIRKGAFVAIAQYIKEQGGEVPEAVKEVVEKIAKQGATPLVVAEGRKILGVISLKDIIKGGIKERFFDLRKMGVRTVMVTGDNPLTAAAIAFEAGVDDFLADATPEAKLKLIENLQNEGHIVAMTGDGTNDAPALAQADVAVAMNTGTQAAKEAGNLVDLDSNPTKLLEIVEIGRQLLITRGAVTTFSIANDLGKYFTILPAAFATSFPVLGYLNMMHLASPYSAILSAVIFNALIIPILIPLALHGAKYRRVSAQRLLRVHALIYGLGGIITPFIGIKIIDLVIEFLHWA